MARLPKEIAKAAKIAEAAGWRVDIRQGKALFFPADKTQGPSRSTSPNRIGEHTETSSPTCAGPD